MLKSFRILSLIEGLSLLCLLFIAMPLKYQMGVQGVVPIVGMIHGLLWTIYFIFSLTVSHKREWSVMKWLFVLLASIIPFACFILDRELKKEDLHAKTFDSVERKE